MSTIPDDEDTPGLAGERTDLAWSRSGLAVVICTAATLKKVLTSLDGVEATAVVFGLIAAGLVAWAFALVHARRIAATTLAGRRVAHEHSLRTMAYGTTVFALGAALLALTP